MRHGYAGKRLGRDMSHRKATMKHLAVALFTHNAITTGHVKAKELRKVVEPLITLAKVDSVANRRLAFARLRDDNAVSNLFNSIAPAFKERPGGYTRILRLGKNRLGDNAAMARIELVGIGEFKEQED